MMRLLSFTLALSLTATLHANSDEVPFAVPRPPAPGQQSPEVTLADIMGKIQVRHIKIWDAIKHKNWKLLDYEVGQTKDSFNRAAILYHYIPIEYIVSADKPLIAMQEAIKSKDSSKLERDFKALTAACNSCHQAAEIGFIIIKEPTSSPFSDQEFSAKRR
jgi:hypothetical protein